MKRLSIIVAVVALAACSARGGGVVPGAGSASAHRAPATFTIHWSASTSSAARTVASLRRPAFISPSAQSIGIQVSPVGSADPAQRVTTTVNKPANGATTSTVSFDAPVGNDDILFAEFDQPNLAGNRLGGAEVFQTIAAGVPNTVSATLDGYVGNVKLNVTGAATGTTLDLSGKPIYTLNGAIPATVVLTLQDADGNTIIAPGTAPLATVTSSNPALFSVTPVPNAPSTYTVRKLLPWADIGVTYAWMPGGTKYLVLNINVTSGSAGNHIYQTSFSVSGMPAIYATSTAGSGAAMNVFAEDGTPFTLPAGAFAGLNQPVALAFDQDDNRIYVADGATNTIQAYGGDGSAVPGWTPPVATGMNSLAYNSVTKTLVAGTNGATPLLGFDNTGKPKSIGAFAGIGTLVGVAYQRYDPPGVTACAVASTTACGQYDVIYANNGVYYNAAYDDYGNMPGPAGQKTAGQIYSIVPTAITASQVPNSAVFVLGTNQGQPVMCMGGAGQWVMVMASRCITTGLASPTSVAADDYGVYPNHLWIAGGNPGLTYGLYNLPGIWGWNAQISTTISYPAPPSSHFTNVLLVY